ncbi:nitroreductase family protein [Candidatus Poriferisodalis sp.]|uniref:nitroreductase family protein n=1 Tax=Candidatus Poriferisodalis sp. TaxID=3101277 RepID=UPI003B52CDC4
MTRHFMPDPVDDVLVARVLDAARRVPSAGNSQGFDFVVLSGASQTARYWDATLRADRRDSFRWASLIACPVLITVWADPGAYVERYAESDKAHTGLGENPDAWSTPFWTVDASFAAMALQYAAIDEGLGVLFFGMFKHAGAVAAALGVPPSHEPIGVVAVGWPDRSAEASSGPAASHRRPRRPLFAEANAHDPEALNATVDRPLVHRGHWLGHW